MKFCTYREVFILLSYNAHIVKIYYFPVVIISKLIFMYNFKARGRSIFIRTLKFNEDKLITKPADIIQKFFILKN